MSYICLLNTFTHFASQLISNVHLVCNNITKTVVTSSPDFQSNESKSKLIRFIVKMCGIKHHCPHHSCKKVDFDSCEKLALQMHTALNHKQLSLLSPYYILVLGQYYIGGGVVVFSCCPTCVLDYTQINCLKIFAKKER